MAAQQTPQGGGGATAPVQAAAATPRSSFPELAPGCVFRPGGPCLFNRHLIPMALRGVLDETCRGFVAVGVDVYAVRPEALLPFPRSNKGMYDQVWDYYFTPRRPTAAAGGGGSAGVVGGSSGSGSGSGSGSESEEDDDVREVAAGGGCWRRYGGEKKYVGDDGEVYGFRRRFAFHDEAAGGARGKKKKTVWRMKEYRINEAAPRFSGVAFHPGGEGLVICKVYNEVIPEEEPAVDYYGINDDDDEAEEVIGAVVITVGSEMLPPQPPLHDGAHLTP